MSNDGIIGKIDINNEELENIKTEIEELPEYQNLEYLYDTASFYRVPFNFLNLSSPSRYKDYILFFNNSTQKFELYKLINNSVNFMFSVDAYSDSNSTSQHSLITGNLDRRILYIASLINTATGLNKRN